jgi:site-specific DNA-adenine methylase
VNNIVPPGAQLYRYTFSEEQHILLCEHVKECRHNVLISYDDHPFIRSLYSNLRFRVMNTDMHCYQLNSKKVRELLIANYGV